MSRQAIGNTNVGVYSPLSILIDGSAPYSLAYNAQRTYPAQSAPYNVADYAQAAGQYLYQIPIRSNNGSYGYVKIESPWVQTSSGTTTIGVSDQAYSYIYDYITIGAYATYPRTFQYWQIDGGSIYSYSQFVDIYYFNNPVIDGNTLVGVFA